MPPRWTCPVCGWTPNPKYQVKQEIQVANHKGYHKLSGDWHEPEQQSPSA